MTKSSKLQCEYKIIDWFVTEDGTNVDVWLLANKKSVKQYCEDTQLPYKNGLRRLYERN
jgi:hypothetical protein